jgi:hypothetical protein
MSFISSFYGHVVDFYHVTPGASLAGMIVGKFKRCLFAEVEIKRCSPEERGCTFLVLENSSG